MFYPIALFQSYSRLLINSPNLSRFYTPGPLMAEKGLFDLIDLMKHLRMVGLNIKLVLLGELLSSIPKEDWIQVSSVPFSKIPELYQSTTVCVIPFPKKLHYSYTRPIKLFDYMASGRPVISLNLFETAAVIKQYKCGLVVKDYNSIGEAIKQLYFHPELVKILGSNGRKAIEKEFNWENNVNKLRI